MAKTNSILATKTTPEGTLLYPNFVTPRDYNGNKEFNYDGLLLVEGPAAASLRTYLTKTLERWSETCGLGARPIPEKRPITPVDGGKVLKDERLNPDDAILLRFKQPVLERGDGTKWDRPPVFFTAEGVPVVEDAVDEKALEYYSQLASLGTGTRAKINFEVYAGKGGGMASLRLQPKGVMIMEPRFFGDGGSAVTADSFDEDEFSLADGEFGEE